MVNRVWGRLIGTLTALGLMAGAASAVTAPILVVDAESGKVLYSQGATDPWYPASVTKLMTAYVALDMVRQGKVSLDTLLTISPAAAAEPPSKMGFKPGTQITLDTPSRSSWSSRPTTCPGQSARVSAAPSRASPT